MMNRIEALRFIEQPLLRIAGVRENAISNPAHSIPEIWQRFVTRHGPLLQHANNIAFGVCMPTAGNSACCDYLAGCEIASNTELPAGLSAVTIPAQRFAIFSHDGHASEISKTVHKIFSEWLPQAGIAAVLAGIDSVSFCEHYGAGYDPATSRGDIEIWVPINGNQR